MFDPWSATLSDAFNEVDAGNKWAFRQFLAARGVSQSRKEIEDGNGLAIMQSVAICAREGLVIPGWLATEFSKRVESVVWADALTWDDPKSFGPPHKKKTRQGSEKMRLKRLIEAWLIAERIKKQRPETPTDAGFFEEIGQLMVPPVGKTVAEGAYYQAKRMIEDGEEVTLDEVFANLTSPGKFE